MSRDTQQAQRFELWLDLAQSGVSPAHHGSGPDLERSLARLCAWVLAAKGQNVAYGLRLEAQEILPARGEAHQRRCLEALALYRSANHV